MGDFYGTGIEIWAGFGLNGQKRGQKCSTGQRFISIEVLLTLETSHRGTFVGTYLRKIALVSMPLKLMSFRSNE